MVRRRDLRLGVSAELWLFDHLRVGDQPHKRRPAWPEERRRSRSVSTVVKPGAGSLRLGSRPDRGRRGGDWQQRGSPTYVAFPAGERFADVVETPDAKTPEFHRPWLKACLRPSAVHATDCAFAQRFAHDSVGSLAGSRRSRCILHRKTADPWVYATLVAKPWRRRRQPSWSFLCIKPSGAWRCAIPGARRSCRRGRDASSAAAARAFVARRAGDDRRLLGRLLVISRRRGGDDTAVPRRCGARRSSRRRRGQRWCAPA